jgi:hypothetical protein
MAFLALCGGFAVITLSGSDIEHLFGKTKITSLTSNDVDLILLLAPLLLTLLFTARSASAGKLRLAHVLPALCAGALLAIIAGPMLSGVVNNDVSQLGTWKNLQNAQSWIVGAGLLLSLMLIWAGGFSSSKSHKKHK